jgi:hypothetical protein
MNLSAGAEATRRHRLHGVGRYPETPPEFLIEMNADATDYAILPEFDEQEKGFVPALDALRGLLASSSVALARPETRELWPPPGPRPPANTLWRWLTRACDLGVLRRHGEDIRSDPFRYALAEG